MSARTPASLPHRLERVQERICAAGGDPGRIKIVAVTKGRGPDAVDAAVAAGLFDIGENYAQALLAKQAVRGEGDVVRWHLIGTVQRNKVKALAPVVALWHAVDRGAAGMAIAARAPGAAVLVEVNTGGERTKSGVHPGAAPDLVDELRELGLDVRGLMTVAPAATVAQAQRAFAHLAALADRLGLPERSMGMSSDLEAAVSEGATIVRVGAALFDPGPTAGQRWG